MRFEFQHGLADISKFYPLPLGKLLMFMLMFEWCKVHCTGACLNEIIPSINRSFVYKAKEGRYVRICVITLVFIRMRFEFQHGLADISKFYPLPLGKLLMFMLMFEWCKVHCSLFSWITL
jgi:hypothetical protein